MTHPAREGWSGAVREGLATAQGTWTAWGGRVVRAAPPGTGNAASVGSRPRRWFGRMAPSSVTRASFTPHVRPLPVPTVPAVESIAGREEGSAGRPGVYHQDLQAERRDSGGVVRTPGANRQGRDQAVPGHQRSALRDTPRFPRYTRSS